MADHDKNLDLKPIELPTAPEISDNDFLLMKDVDSGAILSKKQVRDYRSIFGTGYPRTEDLPEGDIQPPEWTLEGIEGGWRIIIKSVVPDAICYIVYWFDAYYTGQYKIAGGIWEYRENASEGVLELIVRAPAENSPGRVFRMFKIRSVSDSEKGPLSEKKEAWSKIHLPADFVPSAPSLDAENGYPTINYYPMKPGHFAYTILLRILAPAGQKDYIEHYKIFRATDSGSGSFDGTEPYEEIRTYVPENKEVPPSRFPFEDTDPKLTTGWKYRYRVIAVALNGNPSEPGGADPNDYQEITLDDDTTAPDPPTFTVETFATHFEIKFYNPYDSNKPPPTQNNGDPCPDWHYWVICYKPEGQTGDPDEECTGCGTGFLFAGMAEHHQYTQGIPAEWAEKTLVFRAKGVDYAGNESEWSSASDPDKIKKVTGEIIDSRTIDAEHVKLKALTEAEIEDLTITTEKLANLSITETKVDNDAISTPKLQANCVEAAKIAAGAVTTGKLAALAVTADKIAANSVTLSKLNFTPLTSAGETGEIIATINSSSEGIRIGGGKLAIDSETTFTSDVEIQGILKANGGIKTGSGVTRVQLGTYDGSHELKLYVSNTAVGILQAYSQGGYGYLTLRDINGDYESEYYHGMYRLNYGGNSKVETGVSGSDGFIKINGNQVVGSRQNAVGDASTASGISEITLDSGSDSVNRSGFNTKLTNMRTEINSIKDNLNALVGKFNLLLDRLGTSGHGLTAD